MRSITPKKSGKKKPDAKRQPPSRYGTRLALFHAFTMGDGVMGHEPDRAREEAQGVMRVLDRVGIQFRRGRA